MRDLWEIPELWPGSTVYIIGGGPSVSEIDLRVLHDKRCIGVNQAYKLGNWVDVVWFGDRQWYSTQLPAILDYKGLIVTCCQEARVEKRWQRVKYVGRAKPSGIESKSRKHIAWNGNSGASAINLAYWLGAKKIVLLGFEHKLPEAGDRTHWHRDYEPKIDGRTGKLVNSYAYYLKHWKVIAKDARTLGLDLVNATPQTAITEIPTCTLEDTL